jgi:indoleamine 2,3-dioxygenase
VLLVPFLLLLLLLLLLLVFVGWRNNGALPQGLVYEGLWGNQPQQLYGETGAQSTVVHAIDAALGIQHKQGW